jgi:peptidyl-prolyl cis-trans isomerase A (cyclophilin A)
MMNGWRGMQSVGRWVAFAVVAGGLVACGGGSTKSATPSANGTATALGTVAFGQSSNFKITGKNLRNALLDRANSSCNNITLPIVDNDEIYVNCVPTSLAPEFVLIDTKGNEIAVVTASVPEPSDIRVDSITADAGVTLGKVSTFTITGNKLYAALLDPTEATAFDFRPYVVATGCAELTTGGDIDTLGPIIKKFSCIPTSRTPTFAIKTMVNQVGFTKPVNLSVAPVAPLRITAASAPKIAQLTTFIVRGYFEGAAEPKVLTSDCADITTISSTPSFLAFNCKPQTMSAGFEIQNESNVKIGRSLLIPIWVRYVTSLGSFDVELNPTAAPITVANFLQYVNDGYYADTIFHRLTTVADVGYAVNQGGGFTSQEDASSNTPKAGLRGPITLEAIAVTGLSNTLNTIAMARTSDPNSATSQFFFNAANNSTAFDAGGYAVFGEVVSGAAVLQTINTVPRYPGFPQVAEDDIIIQSVTQIQ